MKSVLKATLSLAIALAVLNVGCSAKVEGGSPFEGGPPSANNPNDNQSPPAPPKSVLEGTWKTACQELVSGQVYLIVTATFTDSKFHSEAQSFKDKACTANMGSQTGDGTFVIGAESQAEKGARELDIVRTDKEEKTYDLFLIEDGKLYLGNNPGKTPETRAQTINKKLPFQKQ